jgi:hypothetical protein
MEAVLGSLSSVMPAQQPVGDGRERPNVAGIHVFLADTQ